MPLISINSVKSVQERATMCNGEQYSSTPRKMGWRTKEKAKKDTQTAKKAREMPDLAKKITPGFQALLVIISILTAFISISYLPMQMIHQIISQANAIKKVHSR